MSFEIPTTEETSVEVPATEKVVEEIKPQPDVVKEEGSIELQGRRQNEVAESLIRETADAEKAISAVKLNDKGGIEGLPRQETNQSVESMRQKDGVIDVGLLTGCMVVVFNSNEKIPEGFPDLRSQNRSAEYDPENNIVYVDLSDSWSFLNDKYQPEGLSSFVSHELRHYLVKETDGKVKTETGLDEASRYEPQESEEFFQRAYLDELHSQFFDYISGRGQAGFESPDSDFYSARGRGMHWELASDNPEVQEKTRELVKYTQAFILLNEMIRQEEASGEPKEDIVVDYILCRAGATLGTARSVDRALVLLKNQWAEITKEGNIKPRLESYISTYQRNYEKHTPELSDDLMAIIGI